MNPKQHDPRHQQAQELCDYIAFAHYLICGLLAYNAFNARTLWGVVLCILGYFISLCIRKACAIRLGGK